jgi:hypothetical protein
MEIDLKDLQKIINRLLDHAIQTHGISKVRLKQNFYWDIEEVELYDLDKNPSVHSVGSLKDDWEMVSSLLSSDRQPVVYQLTEVAPILRHVGETLGKDLAKAGG